MAEKVLVQDVEPETFILALATKLREISDFKMPEWASFVKTSMSRQRPPESADWWYIRAASILRSLYIRGLVGVSKLRVKYGSRKNRGMKPERFYKSSGKLIRTILQQASKAGLAEVVKDKKPGRKLTRKGKEFLEQLALQFKND